MANYANLKAAIDTVIKANGQQEITGTLLNQTLTTIVNSLGAGYQYMGVAKPSTNPGTPDQNVFYLATQEGVYVNFNNVQIYGASLKIFTWDGTWKTEDILDLVGFEQKMDEVVAWLQAYQPIVIEGNVNNAPDEEDLTSVDEDGTNVLKFKNKAYAPALFSGLGREYLRKNIINIGGENKNILTQSMINKPNTVYIIQYDYDLNDPNGENPIIIPENCVLEFDGGSLSNGTLVGNGTGLKGGYNVLFRNIKFTGSYVGKIDINWFPIIYNEQVDNAPILDAALLLASLSDKKELKLNEGSIIWVQSVLPNPNLGPSHYYVDGSVQIRSGVTFDMNNSTIKCLPNNSIAYNILYSNNAENIKICNGVICGDLNEHTGTTGEWGCGISILAVHGFTIENVICEYVWGDGIFLDVPSLGSSSETDEHLKSRHPMDGVIRNCICRYNRRQGLSLDAGFNITIEDSLFHNTSGTNPQAGIDIEPGHFSNKVKDSLIRNCEFHHNAGDGIRLWNHAAAGIGDCIENVTIDNCYSHDNSAYDYSLCGNNTRLTNSKKNFSFARVDGYTNTGVEIDNCKFKSIVFNIGHAINCVVTNCNFEVKAGNSIGLVYIMPDATHKKDITFNNCTFSVSSTATLSNSTLVYAPTISNDSIITFESCIFDTSAFNIFGLTKEKIIRNCVWRGLIVYFDVKVAEGDSITFTGNTIERMSTTSPVFNITATSGITATINLTNTKIVRYVSTRLFAANNAFTLKVILDGTILESIENSLYIKSDNITLNATRGVIHGYYPAIGKTVYSKIPNRVIFTDDKGFTPNISKGTFADAQALVTNNKISSMDKGFEFYATDKGKPIYYGGDSKWYDASGTEVTA